ncbi:MAG: hypothetical protein Q9167_005896 [Letrouitia subvulpina]
MTFLSRALTLLGLLLLSHAPSLTCSCYSAYEHASLHTVTQSSSSQRQDPLSTSLPLDISLETVVSVLVICLGLVLGAEELRPVSWRVWAGKIQRETGKAGPFEGLEDRVGFMDIRAQRKEFADWVRRKGDGSGR